jgi:uncharacterized protein (TIGR02246 family)
MTHDDIIQLFSNWNDAIQTGDPDKVTAMYADNAVLLPTVSNQVRHNHAEIRDYFVSFLGKVPSGVINEANPRQLTDDLVSNTGIYTFTFGDGAQVMARYSYLYQRIDGDWKILEHHSSAMPEPV